MSEAFVPVEIFCSYAHADEGWREKLERHVSPLKQQGLISLWHDRFIVPGTNWAKTIDTRLETASVILLLVSADFFASDYCAGIEMKRALARQETNEALVIPILVRPTIWQDAPFAHLQVLPPDAKSLSTWSDEEIALAEVAAGIRHAIQEIPLLSASAPRTTLPAIWNIPYPRNSFFLGRENELAQIHSHLQAGKKTALSQPQAISGLGGIGKTQIALEYAYRYHQEYQAVLWTRAESTEALISSYMALAALLRLPEREAKEQEVTVQAVKTWLQTHCGWLLVLDNADELALISGFLPPMLAGHLLLTTRAATTGRLAHRREIKTLLPEHSALFLLRRAGLIEPSAPLEQASLEERNLALKISEELGELPLALDQAGAYLEETGMCLDDYCQIYQRHRAKLLREHRDLVGDHPAPVATTWLLSFGRVEEKNPAEADLLRLCAFLAPDAIPEEILTKGASQLGWGLVNVAADAFLLNQAIEALRAYSLVQRDPKQKCLSIHRLVQAVLQDQLSEEETCCWSERAMLAVNAAFPDNDDVPHMEYHTWPQCERLLAHALLSARYVEQNQSSCPEAGQLLSKTACYLRERARYPEAEALYRHALRIKEQQLGPDHLNGATTLNGLAILYRKQGKHTQAEPLYQRVLTLREQQLGLEHLDVVYPLIGLANLYSEQGKYIQAEPLYQQALSIFEQQLGPTHLLVTYPLNNLAELFLTQGKYGEAEPLFLRALALREQQLEKGHPPCGSLSYWTGKPLRSTGEI